MELWLVKSIQQARFGAQQENGLPGLKIERNGTLLTAANPKTTAAGGDRLGVAGDTQGITRFTAD